MAVPSSARTCRAKPFSHLSCTRARAAGGTYDAATSPANTAEMEGGMSGDVYRHRYLPPRNISVQRCIGDWRHKQHSVTLALCASSRLWRQISRRAAPRNQSSRIFFRYYLPPPPLSSNAALAPLNLLPVYISFGSPNIWFGGHRSEEESASLMARLSSCISGTPYPFCPYSAYWFGSGRACGLFHSCNMTPRLPPSASRVTAICACTATYLPSHREAALLGRCLLEGEYQASV